jgi:hypothetical protein
MDTLLLKLVATPLLIGLATLIGRRWGQAVGGWLVGLPLTSGPVAFFLALDRGTDFAAATTAGSLKGIAAESSFCIAYAACARRAGWPGALLAGSLTFAAAATLLSSLPPMPRPTLVAMAIGVILIALYVTPRFTAGTPAATAPRWDLAARMAATTALVVALTAAAGWLGPELSGLLATYPLFASVLAVFGQRAYGADAALNVLRGLLLGLFSFAAFFVVLGAAIVPLGIAWAFAASALAAIAAQGVSLLIVRRSLRRMRAPSP